MSESDEAKVYTDRSEITDEQSEYIVGASDKMKRVLYFFDETATTETTVLITGESGTGKEKIARFIHLNSARAGRPFVTVNAGAIPETLIESELFGHVRGAFTDARDRKRGLFELADGGTLFLDEIAETSPGVQIRLLRALQEREIRPVGGDTNLKVDVRIVAATNKDLREAMADGTFREDLFYRLNVFRIQLPPLRERREDIPFLAEYFLRLYCEKNRKKLEGFTDRALALLLNYAFPGNVRELENAVERSATLAEGTHVRPLDLPPEIAEGGLPMLTEGKVETFPDDLTLEELERRYIQRVLDRKSGNMTHAAKSLGISRSTLWRKVSKYGLRVD